MQVVIKNDRETNGKGGVTEGGGLGCAQGVLSQPRLLLALKASAFGRNVQRSLEELREAGLQLMSGVRPFVPTMKVRSERAAFVISALLPGVDEETVQVAFEGAVVKVNGARTEQRETTRRKWHRVVKTSRTFERIIQIDGEYDRARAVATIRGDILCIYLPKGAASEAPPPSVAIEPDVAAESAAQ